MSDPAPTTSGCNASPQFLTSSALRFSLMQGFRLSALHAVLSLLLFISITFHMRFGMQVIAEEYAPHGLKVPRLFLNTFWTFSVAVACTLAIIKLYLGM
jgi:succinate dehydrogenase hydrophobic anchor subunit